MKDETDLAGCHGVWIAGRRVGGGFFRQATPAVLARSSVPMISTPALAEPLPTMRGFPRGDFERNAGEHAHAVGWPGRR